ncbi:MAG: hypothetical protein IKA10_05750 [Oscillospiraceae bacterium]|nr:hypothetical protein [Oscillospiraceae bacterium]
MAKKPIKIKRNNSISGKRRQRNYVVKKVLSLVFAAAALLAIGFMGAPAIAEMAENMSKPKPQNTPSPTPVVTAPAETQPTTDPSDIQIDTTKEKFVYGMVEQTALYSEDAFKAAVDAVKAKGADNVVVTLKDAQGLVWFDTQTEIGQQAKSSTLADVKRLAEICEEKDVALTVQLYVFQDRITPTINRDTAVKYKGTDMNWLDTSKEFGGKPWANPASSAMQDYIYALVKELMDMGAEDFIFTGVQLPTGYSLEMRDFGVNEAQLQAQLQGFINTLSSKVAAKGGDAYFAFDIKAISGADVAKYIVAPQRYGAENIVAAGTAEDFAAHGESAVAALGKDENVERVVVWNTDGSAETDPKADNGYFVK